jgi:DNA-binding transcriptional MocR family regulator
MDICSAINRIIVSGTIMPMTPWRPKLSSARSRPVFRRLFDAIAHDIHAGKLAAGDRLPPQRELADALSISVGAVTRAYDEAGRRGLITAHVGRGTFVIDRSRSSAPDAPIDLSINTAPIAPVDAMVETIDALRRMTSWAGRLDYQPPCGMDADRRARAAWLQRTAGFDELDWRTLLCCAGAQNGMAIALAALCKPGDAILCEAASFSGVKTLAAQQGYRLHGVDLDSEGLRPGALDRAAATTGARVLYALPTLQNPTARVMGATRRAEIVKVARARDLWILEDDVYATYARSLDLPPLAQLAPERTIYVSSLSKILAPGLRGGMLVASPGKRFDACVRAARAFNHSPSGVGAAIATDWIESGRADELAREVRAETATRTKMALAALAGVADEPPTMSLHVWLPMSALDAERVVARAGAAGVRLTSSSAFAVSPSKQANGLRLCLGNAASHAALERALSIVKAAVAGDVEDNHRATL